MFSIGKPQGRCLSCNNKFIGPGDRCQSCQQKLRLRRRRKPR
jgi:rRNA maturation endonuclease Nob1